MQYGIFINIMEYLQLDRIPHSSPVPTAVYVITQHSTSLLYSEFKNIF